MLLNRLCLGSLARGARPSTFATFNSLADPRDLFGGLDTRVQYYSHTVYEQWSINSILKQFLFRSQIYERG